MALNDSNRNKVRLDLYWLRDWIPHGIQDWLRDWIPHGIQDWIRDWIPDGIQDWIQDWTQDPHAVDPLRHQKLTCMDSKMIQSLDTRNAI